MRGQKGLSAALNLLIPPEGRLFQNPQAAGDAGQDFQGLVELLGFLPYPGATRPTVSQGTGILPDEGKRAQPSQPGA